MKDDPGGSAASGGRDFDIKPLYSLVRRLRDPESGCPWDRSRTLSDMAGTLLEEAREAAEALRGADAKHQSEELGDALMNIMLAAIIAEDQGLFRWEDVVRGIMDKLIRRHPHVFGGAKANTPEEAMAMFLAAKAEEKGRFPD